MACPVPPARVGAPGDDSRDDKAHPVHPVDPAPTLSFRGSAVERGRSFAYPKAAP